MEALNSSNKSYRYLYAAASTVFAAAYFYFSQKDLPFSTSLFILHLIVFAIIATVQSLLIHLALSRIALSRKVLYIILIPLIASTIQTASESLYFLEFHPKIQIWVFADISLRFFLSLMFFIIITLTARLFAEREEMRKDLAIEAEKAAQLSAKIEAAKRSEEANPAATVVPIDRITVKTPQGLQIIYVQDIIYMMADGDYVAIVTEKGRWLKEQTMKYYQENLPEKDFVRVHRSYIVRIDSIGSIERSGEQIRLRLKGDNVLRISDAGYKNLKVRLGL